MANTRSSFGEGDTFLVEELSIPANAFASLLREVDFKVMYHNSGPVPRLVAVQGIIEDDGSEPIYRHPADQSPNLSPISKTVLNIKTQAEAVCGHSLNHVLIQLYRDGSDNISEHSDKTLDISPGSYVCNVSLGAERTMILRRKNPEYGASVRVNQKIPLPHNSIFLLGPKTNEKWTHSIKADKRPQHQKTSSQLVFDQQRISLTFRNISTFHNHKRIWGTGAKSKFKESANEIVQSDCLESDAMIAAFGKENRLEVVDWLQIYGKGFDVVDFAKGKSSKLYLGSKRVSNRQVLSVLMEAGIPHDVQKDNIGEPTVLLELNTEEKLQGVDSIFRYAEKYHTRNSAPLPVRFDSVMNDLQQLDNLLASSEFISGETFGLDDCKSWPIIAESESDLRAYRNLFRYFQRVKKRSFTDIAMNT